MQQNSQCRLCGDRDETIDRIISECSKFVRKEYKTRKVRVGKVYPLGDVQKMLIYPYEQMVYAQPRTCPRK